jgi:hypothetical protein
MSKAYIYIHANTGGLVSETEECKEKKNFSVPLLFFLLSSATNTYESSLYWIALLNVQVLNKVEVTLKSGTRILGNKMKLKP